VLEQRGDGFEGSIHYDTDLFDAATVARLAGHFRALLAGAAARPDRRISEHPLLASGERHQVMIEWSGPAAGPAPPAAHHLYEACVDRDPEAPAVIDGDRMLTYGELDRLANRLAGRLRELGAGPDARVALLLERSPELVASVLATLKAGAAWLALDPEYAAERLAFMLRDSAAAILITDRRRLASLDGLPTPARPLLLDEEGDALGRREPGRPAVPVHPDNLAYVI